MGKNKVQTGIFRQESICRNVDFTDAKCCRCCWWRPHGDGKTGNCIAEPPRIPVQVPQQVPVYYLEPEIVIRGQQTCVHPTTQAADLCRLYEPKTESQP